MIIRYNLTNRMVIKMSAVQKEVKANTVNSTKTAAKVAPKEVVKTAKGPVIAEKAAPKVEKTVVKTVATDGTTGLPVKTVEKAVKTVAQVAVAVNIGELNVSNDCKIECAANPKRAGSKAHTRYAAYEKATTIGEYLERGGLRADLRYDLLHGFLIVKDVVIDGKIVNNPKLATK